MPRKPDRHPLHPVGTVKRVRVRRIICRAGLVVVICTEESNPVSGYACCFDGEYTPPLAGQAGTVTLDGDGDWKFEPVKN
ncbi:MAG: hypothetical protein JWN86_703 [Planctomycetota bacterium]|nr:hypothetical protein [Planctomycetota bacterium]